MSGAILYLVLMFTTVLVLVNAAHIGEVHGFIGLLGTVNTTRVQFRFNLVNDIFVRKLLYSSNLILIFPDSS